MTLSEVTERFQTTSEPISVRRQAWPNGLVSVFDGDGIEKLDATGELSLLSSEDRSADDWVIEKSA